MKATCRALALAALIVPAAAYATKIPIPIDGATLNVSIQVQTQAQLNQNGTPDGTGTSFDVYMRRTRLLVNGDINQNFSYLLQIDNANFGKWGNFTPRAIVQDAWVGWAPGGITGGTVIYFDAGILLIPISHHLLESTTNFVASDVQTDIFRFAGNTFQGLRDTGIQVRGWALNKKIGWRGGIYEGLTPGSPILGAAPINLNGVPAAAPLGACLQTPSNVATSATSCLTPHRMPMFGGYVNVDLIGSEEGGWLYGAYKWGKDPIVSIHAADNYQSLAVRNLNGNLNDMNVLNVGAYANLPIGGEASELVAELELYKNNNGSNTANTGNGGSLEVGFRFGGPGIYASVAAFTASDCDTGAETAAQLAAHTCELQGAGTPHANDTREGKLGIVYFFNKNLNHMNLEFIESHGQSTYGAGAITAGNAGYAPLVRDPATAGGTRSAFNANLRYPALWTLLYHWNVLF
jgi:hypothetical protein